MRTIIYIAAILAAIVGIGSFFKISDIQVTGNVIYSEQEILEVAGIELGDNLFLVNKRSAEEAILENRGFADTITVKRKLPDTIEINVRESRLLAYVQHGDDYYVLNRKCELLSKTDAVGVAGHIWLQGISPVEPEVGRTLELSVEEEAKGDYLAEVMELMLENELYSQVQWIDVSNVSSLKFLYRGGITVDLGKNEELERKFDMLESILADRAENDKGTISLVKPGEGHFIPEQ